MKKVYIDLNFPLIHFGFAQKCLVQVPWKLSKMSTYKEEGVGAHSLFSLRNGPGWVRKDEKGPVRVKCITTNCRLESPYPICNVCAEQSSDGFTITERKMWIRIKKTLLPERTKFANRRDHCTSALEGCKALLKGTQPHTGWKKD